VARAIKFIRNHNPGTFRSDKDEIWMWHFQDLTAIGANLVRLEGNRRVVIPNDVNEHETRLSERSEEASLFDGKNPDDTSGNG